MTGECRVLTTIVENVSSSSPSPSHSSSAVALLSCGVSTFFPSESSLVALDPVAAVSVATAAAKVVISAASAPSTEISEDCGDEFFLPVSAPSRHRSYSDLPGELPVPTPSRGLTIPKSSSCTSLSSSPTCLTPSKLSPRSGDLALAEYVKMKNSLNAYRFSAETNSWVVSPASSSTTSLDERREIKVVSYNVCFKDFHYEKRLRSIFQLLLSTGADVICLQEVKPEFVVKICREAWVRSDFFVSDCSGDSVEPYGLLILSKFPVESFTSVTLPSRMRRTLLLCDLRVKEDKIVTVANVHLESLEDTKTRVLQLQICVEEFLEKSNDIIFAGDLNIFPGTTLDEERFLEEFKFIDVWNLLHPASSTEGSLASGGYTMPEYGCWRACRPDRMLLKCSSSSSSICACWMKIFGKENLPYSPKETTAMRKKQLPLTPSDHFGIISCFSLL